MKMMKIIISVVMLTSYIMSKESLNLKNEAKKLDIIGEAYNTDNKPVVAVTYGVANNKGYSLPDSTGYVQPEMVVKIAEQVRLAAPGPLEAVEEV